MTNLATATGIRFAPSPTGRLHVGNLRTAWIAQWWAKTLEQKLVLRSEDIDQARNVAGAHGQQLRDLNRLNIHPDEIVIQSQRRARHWELFWQAHRENMVYACTCSRKQVGLVLESFASAPQGAGDSGGKIYSGHCRRNPATAEKLAAGNVDSGVAWRFKNEPESGTADFVVARTESFAPDEESFSSSYHWACAIDDFDGNYSLLVRAWDLLSALPLQRRIQRWLGATTTTASAGISGPAVFHTSLVTREDGGRLEKRTAGVTLEELALRGISSRSLRDAIEQSFRGVKAEYVPGAIWGEARKTLRFNSDRFFYESE